MKEDVWPSPTRARIQLGWCPFLEHLETSNGVGRIAFSFDFYEDIDELNFGFLPLDCDFFNPVIAPGSTAKIFCFQHLML